LNQEYEESIKYNGLAEIFPPKNQIFNAFNYFDIDELKVILIGQDPYHQVKQAHGLCFSIAEDSIKLPPSLKNIYKELETDINEGKIIENKNGNFEYLAKQGILLLNNTLTVRESSPNSHIKIWKTFTKNLINQISMNCDNIIFILWGNNAKNIKKHINKSRIDDHIYLECNHPSPLSANRGGWFGNKHFSKTNNILEELGKEKIVWINR
jgi:uracil-DNA glycosylase